MNTEPKEKIDYSFILKRMNHRIEDNFIAFKDTDTTGERNTLKQFSDVFDEALQQHRQQVLDEVFEKIIIPAENIIDDEECSYDHHGYCQTHNLEEDCSVKKLRNNIQELKQSLGGKDNDTK